MLAYPPHRSIREHSKQFNTCVRRTGCQELSVRMCVVVARPSTERSLMMPAGSVDNSVPSALTPHTQASRSLHSHHLPIMCSTEEDSMCELQFSKPIVRTLVAVASGVALVVLLMIMLRSAYSFLFLNLFGVHSPTLAWFSVHGVSWKDEQIYPQKPYCVGSTLSCGVSGKIPSRCVYRGG